ncbi:hypothetical protein [Eggerthella lenta]|jgi:hypothetical protein|uniref:hypothetical protein n=1 Tax=Eggerthella lenta TaxID=84112 RepID=UPI001F45F4A4|nr:hypothetical protein [Eggerthella lenta]
MENRTITITLSPEHKVSLTSDAPDIGKLVNTIVEIKDQFDPEQVEIDCDFDGFDKQSFKEIVIQAADDFIQEIQLDKNAFEQALKELEKSSEPIDTCLLD